MIKIVCRGRFFVPQTYLKHIGYKILSLRYLFTYLFKLSGLTFGGGVVILGILENELPKRNDITAEEFSDMVALATSMPGPIAVSISWLIGKYYRGIIGGIVAVLGAVMPPFLIILFLTPFIVKYADLPAVHGFLGGILAATGAMITVTVVGNVKSALSANIRNLIPYLVIIIMIGFLKINPLIAILTALALQYALEKTVKCLM